VREVCVNASRWDCTLEPAGASPRLLAGVGGARSAPGAVLALRLGLRMVKGLGNAHAARIVAARADIPFAGIDDLWRRVEVPRAALEALAAADAFRSLGIDRRVALWAIRGLAGAPLPLFAAAQRNGAAEDSEPAVILPPLPAGGEVMADYRTTGLSLRAHPVAFLRVELSGAGMIACAALAQARDGARVVVPGLVLVRQRPGSARGVLFMTIEDETGFANLIVWPDRFERQRRLILSAGMVAARGQVQREGEVVHVIVEDLTDLSALLAQVGGALRVPTRDFR